MYIILTPLGRANAHRVDSTKTTQLKVKSLNFTGVNKHYQLSELKIATSSTSN